MPGNLRSFTVGAGGFSLTANKKSFGRHVFVQLVYCLGHKCESEHDKTKKMTCAPSKNSDQPEYLPSLIRHEITLGSLLSLERTAKTLIRLCQCADQYPHSLGNCVIL